MYTNLQAHLEISVIDVLKNKSWSSRLWKEQDYNLR